MTGIDAATAKRRLEQERDALVEESKSHRDDRRPVTLDQQSVGRLSRIDAIQLQEMALEAERRRQGRIKRIEAALARIEQGEYGYCVACGEEIAPKRLALDPAVPTCIACAGLGR